MSVRVMSQVWELPLPALDKLVLLALADCANDEGHCWPSIATLKRKTGVGERTIQKAIKGLAKLGILTRHEVVGKGCNYVIHPPHEMRPARDAPRTRCAPPPHVVRATPARDAPKPSINRKEPSEVKSADADHLTPADILEGYNELAAKCGLPLAEKLTGGRLRQAKARLREYPGPEPWRRAFKHIHDTPFLRGENDRGWRADLDFVLQAKSFTKLVEGSYGKAH